MPTPSAQSTVDLVRLLARARARADAAEARCKALEAKIAEIQRWAVIVVPVVGGDTPDHFEHPPWRKCRLCYGEWRKEWPEEHATACPMRPEEL